VRSRKAPNAEIEIGHLSTRLCHLGNIAYRLGRKLKFDGASESFPDDPEANKLLSREYSSRFEMPSQV
jgi:GFO/IDH/MocA oxidoreductase family protein